MSKLIKHSVIIDEHYFEVWETLTKLHEYGNWNNFFFAAKGLLIEGHEIKVRMKVSKQAMSSYASKMQEKDPNMVLGGSKNTSIPSSFQKFKIRSLKNLSHFELQNKTWFRFFVNIVLRFKIEDINDKKTRFVLTGNFSGLIIEGLGMHVMMLYEVMLQEIADGLKIYMENGQNPVEFAEEA